MKQLTYFTRGGSSPEHKPNVYFTSHPDDFEIYFRLLAEEVLAHSNCAIWYAEYEKSIEDEEHLGNLEQMQLLVFPITTRFLTDGNIGLHEVKYAIKQHIPVIPIMVEHGLEKRFSQVCGDIQLVDRTSTDITAMGYEERLSRFIKSVLASDDTAQKIRSAFDAYVFLSYRKKDRVYAQKLMRLIHSNETCRDIAIWYDEFLVPGENFNEAIANEMRSSDAFVLAVTPHLLEEGNYVQRTEYPFAKQLGKRIMPFELVKTERQLLEDKFEDLPECVNANETSVQQYMLNAYRTLAVRPDKRDPVHNFYIGLAYLNGIDVEKDTDKAVTLISDSAESGLPEAMEKLVSMYREGEGVERNYDEALKWQKRCVARLKELVTDDSLSEEMNLYLSALSDLVGYYIELDRYSEAETPCESLEYVSLRCGATDYYMLAIYQRSKIAQGMALQGENTENGQTLYLKCCEFYRDEYGKTQSDLALQMMTQCYLELGRIANGRFQTTIAREYYEKGIGYCKHLTRTDGAGRYKYLLSVMLSEHAKTETFLNNFNAAQNDIDEALEIAQALYDEYRTPDLCKNAADLHMQMGGLLAKKAEIPRGRQEYDIAERMYNEYKQKTAAADADSMLLDLYDSMAESYASEDQYDIAMQYYKREENLAESINGKCTYVDIDDVCWRIDIGKAELLAKDGHITEAMSKYARVYKSIENATSNSEELKQQYRLLLFAIAVLAYSHAKENNLTDYIREYRKKLMIVRPQISIPKGCELKELWQQNTTIGGVTFNIMSTYGELLGDMLSWSFEDGEFMGLNLSPILKWLHDKLFIWRIPFYPVLSMFLLIVIHFITGCMDFELPLMCYEDCLIGQSLYQCIASVTTAISFAVIHKGKKIERKKLMSVIVTVLLCLVTAIGIIVTLGKNRFMPDAPHVTYLLIPVYSAIAGWFITMIAKAFLSRITRNYNDHLKD